MSRYAYSLKPNPWQWLTSQQLAEDMAVQVAQWRDLYNIDGIDLDIEAGAGDKKVMIFYQQCLMVSSKHSFRRQDQISSTLSENLNLFTQI